MVGGLRDVEVGAGEVGAGKVGARGSRAGGPPSFSTIVAGSGELGRRGRGVQVIPGLQLNGAPSGAKQLGRCFFMVVLWWCCCDGGVVVVVLWSYIVHAPCTLCTSPLACSVQTFFTLPSCPVHAQCTICVHSIMAKASWAKSLKRKKCYQLGCYKVPKAISCFGLSFTSAIN